MPPRKFGTGSGWSYNPSSNTYSARGHFPQYETIVRGKRTTPFPGKRISLSDQAMMHHRGRDYGRKILNQNRTDLLAKNDFSQRLRNNFQYGSGRRTGKSGIDWMKETRRGRQIARGTMVTYTGPGMVGAIPGGGSQLGRRVLRNLSKWKYQQFKLTPPARSLGGSCWGVTANRMKKAYASVVGRDMFEGVSKDRRLVFESIAGSRSGVDPWTGYNWMKQWKKVPKKLRYTGVPGALSYLGLAKVVEGPDVWKGKISPGSPLQLWYGMGRVGHSAVLNRYIHNKKGKISGLVYSDQWLDYKVVLKKEKKEIIGAKFLR